jgi:hypothetical protein
MRPHKSNQLLEQLQLLDALFSLVLVFLSQFSLWKVLISTAEPVMKRVTVQFVVMMRV